MMLLQVMENALSLDFSRIILQSSDYECLLRYISLIIHLESMITKALSLMLETPETIKDEGVKGAIIDILCICVAKHEKGPRSGILKMVDVFTRVAIQMRIVQEYLREEHLADFVSDLLETLVNSFDGSLFFENVIKYDFIIYFEILIKIGN